MTKNRSMIKSTITSLWLLILLAVVSCLASIIPTSSSSSSMAASDHPHRLQKKSSFSSIGCLGTYDRAKFARLDRICDECYQLYRNEDIHQSCREFCFKNDVFPACVDALMLSHEEKELNGIAEEMLGRR